MEKLKELLDDDASDSIERFGLFWPGKKRAIRAAQTPTSATLAPDYDNSKDWDETQNVFIEGDNLEVLKVLQKHYHGKIKMIYIDPPYNTGKDFVYPDNYKDGVDSYLEWSQQVNEEGKPLSTNTETGGRIHSNWLNMMYPRLKLARNLLTDDGVIFISIDDWEQDTLQRSCAEIFGERNFLGKMVWHARGRSKTPLSIDHEYALVFAKNRSAILPIYEDQENGNWYGEPIQRKYSNPDNDSRGRWRDAQHTVTKKKAHYTYSINRFTGEVRPEIINDYQWYGHETWMYPTATIQKLFADDRLYFSEHGERLTLKVKKFASEELAVTSLAGLVQRSDISSRHGSEEVDKLLGPDIFSYPKPVALLKRFLQATTAKHHIILDFFAGSGSTAHAVMQLNAEDGGNRRHIQVQLPEPTPEKSEARKAGYDTISEISRERIRRAGEKIKADFADQLTDRETPLDTGFRAYKLTDTNFAKWHVGPDTSADELGQQLLDYRDSTNDDAGTAAIFTELLLKQGLSLTERTTTTTISGLQCHVVHDTDGDITLLAYLDERETPTLEQLRELVAANPLRMVILEDCFDGNDELKTNLKQMCVANDIELKTA